MSWIKTTITMLLVTACTFELGSFVLTKYQLLLINQTPLIYQSENRFPNIEYGRTEREIWGAWHASNSTYSHVESCFDITMSFNEIGARDDSFRSLPSNSLFLLGDSFAEGFGVEKTESSEYLIEQKLGIPILNFGASGDFGPLQEYLIYEHYNYLPHQGLIVYVLPANDFTDNDAKTWRSIDQQRFRPYFNEVGDPLTPYYFPLAIPRDDFHDDFRGPLYKFLKKIIKDYLWSANALKTILMIARGDVQLTTNNKNVSTIESHFYDATHMQQANLIAAYEGILDSVNDRNVLFVIIPAMIDITRWENKPDRDSYKEQLWYSSFESFQEKAPQRVSILNLLEYLPNDQRDKLFFTCDGHWSPYGNKWASGVIVSHIKNNNLFEFTEGSR